MDSCDENGNGVLGVCVPIPLVVVVVVVVVVLCSIAFVCLTVGAVLVFLVFFPFFLSAKRREKKITGLRHHGKKIEFFPALCVTTKK